MNKIIGKNIQKRRELIGWSRDDLAKILKLSPQEIEHYENGTNPIPAANLVIIAREFYCSLDTLCGYHSLQGRLAPSPLLSDDKQLEETIQHLASLLLDIEDMELRKFLLRTLTGVSMLNNRTKTAYMH